MAVTVETLVGALQAVPLLERRSPAEKTDYLEGVISRQELKRCYELLMQQFGSATKEFGQPAKFDRVTTQLVERIGGIWNDQCLFFSAIDGKKAVYAALWPWNSDPTKVTLKAGAISL